MKQFPVFLFIIPAGLIVVILALFFSLHIETIIPVIDSWFSDEDPERPELLFYLSAAAIPVLSGIFMCLVIVLISRTENKQFEREWERVRQCRARYHAGVESEFMENLDSINESIVKLREMSTRMKDQTKQLSSFGRDEKRRQDEEKPADSPGGETVSTTLENFEVSGLRIIHAADFYGKDINLQEPSQQELFPPHESHQKIWYFPNI
ncbi:MAG: hypothetical protein LBQ55_09150 [Treponema sp.]|jgi:hypothetical protein|nr:hypothetical protein [Treponema sp.]